MADQYYRITILSPCTRKNNNSNTTYFVKEINNSQSKVNMNDFREVIGDCSLYGEVTFEELYNNCYDGYNNLMNIITINNFTACLKLDGQPYIYEIDEQSELRSIFHI